MEAREYDRTTASPSKQRWALGVAAAAIAVGVGVAVWAGRGDDRTKQPPDDPAVFLRGIVSRIANHDHDAVWPLLHRRARAP